MTTNPHKKDDDTGLAAGKIFAVWTPTFDCGVEFQVGETYLVYATMDEDTDMVETDTFTRTYENLTVIILPAK